MKTKIGFLVLSLIAPLCAGFVARAQDLGPGFTKVKEGIYVYAAKPGNSTCSVVLTDEGPVVIDACQTPPDAHRLMAGIKKLTDKPIRYLIDTEVHNDHTFGHYVFSPPAVVINHEGATEGMKKGFDPKRAETLASQSPEMREAVKGYRMITPQIEYRNKMTLRLGERTFELLSLKNVHSEADTAIWLPKERVLFAASAANVRTIINLRPFVTMGMILPIITISIHHMEQSRSFNNCLRKRTGENFG